METISRKEAKEKGLVRYFTGKPCGKGHLSERFTSTKNCVTCHQERRRNNQKSIDHKYRPNFKLKCFVCSKEIFLGVNHQTGISYCRIIDSYRPKLYCSKRCKDKNRRLEGKAAAYKRKKYREDQNYRNKKIEKERIRRKRPEVKKRQNELARVWKENNLERHRNNKRIWQATRRRDDLDFKIKLNLSLRIYHALKGGRKSSRTIELIGCEISDLKRYMEELFLIGMDWNNWEQEGWHIDHVRPCALFDLTEEEQQKVCFNWRNLQPMWSKENQSKGKIYTEEDEKIWVKRMRDLGFEGELFLKY